MTNAAQANKHDSDTLDMHSPNLVDNNVQKIMALFPNCITESEDENGKLKKSVDFDLLRQELSQSLVEGGQERYRLDWPGKRQAILEANSPIAKTLRPARDESVNFDTTENLFIEGDNLDALKLLQESYLGQVKMIYIDPPYNTGNDFIYEDNFSENTADFLERSEQLDEEGNRLVTNTESNGRFHSDWLTMMYSRLKLARNLLKDDGVIFISINDKEEYNLRKMCNEIFGESNFVTNIHVELSATQGMKVKAAKSGNIVKNGEYITIYSKNGNKSIATNVLYDHRPDFDSHYSKIIDNGKLYSLKDYFNKDNNGNEISNLSEAYKENKIFKNFVEKNLDRIVADDKISGFDLKDYKENQVYEVHKNERNYLIVNNGKKLRQLLRLSSSYGQCDDFYNSYGLRKIRGNWWKEFYLDMGNVSKEGNITYSNGKKPLRLIKQTLFMTTNPDDIILDFFAGSSTTAHAVIQLNTEDGGNRKFIMVQLDEPIDSNKQKDAYEFCLDNNFEPNISEISKERIRRAGQKILVDNQDKEGIEDLDIGFRVLKIDSTNMKDVYYTPDEYSQVELDNLESHIKEDRTGEDLLFQVMLDWGVPLSLPIEVRQIQGSSVYYVGIDSLVACFDTLTTDLIDEISKDKPLKFVSSELAIAHDQDKTNVKARFAQLSPDTQVKFI